MKKRKPKQERELDRMSKKYPRAAALLRRSGTLIPPGFRYKKKRRK